MKKYILFILLGFISFTSFSQNRFPKPDFESGYQYPEIRYPVPHEQMWVTIDLIVLVVMMIVVAWAVLRKRVRWPIVLVSLLSILYFGFFRHGCVCSIGSVQNIALALVDHTYVLPLSVLLFFTLPILFTLLFGRVFCGGVCPFGALQELVNVKQYRLSRVVSMVLSIIPWIYLAFALLFAVTHSGFIICRFDPFVGIFRMGGETVLILFGVLLLLASVFTGRPFCRFICPYGALLSLFSSVSIWKTHITQKNCINCELCHNACPVDAIQPPYENKVKESRTIGVRRIVVYLLVLPLMMLLGGGMMCMMSPSFSQANKTIRLYEKVLAYEAHPQEMQSMDLQGFYGQGGTIEELRPQVELIKKDFRFFSTLAGAFIGLVIGFKLIGLSVKRGRKQYEIDDASCVNCAKCFHYCPQNKIQKDTER